MRTWFQSSSDETRNTCRLNLAFYIANWWQHATNSEQDQLFIQKNVNNFRMFYCARSKLYQFRKQFTIDPNVFLHCLHSTQFCSMSHLVPSALPVAKITEHSPRPLQEQDMKIAYIICINCKSITEEI